MSIKFWLGGVGSDRSRRLIKYILDEAEAHPDRQYLYIVPEQFGLATQRELVMGSKNHGILNIDVLSFTRLAHRISDEVGSFENDVTMLDDMGKSLLIGMLAGNMRGDLKVYGDNLDKPGYIDRLKSMISEYMQYGITPEKAFEMADDASSAGRGQLAAKLHDLAVIYKAFKEHIKGEYTTVEETLDNVSRLIHKSATIANGVVIFDGFTGFTPVQNKLIGVLMEYALSVHVSLAMEDCIQNRDEKDRIQEHELFYLSKHTIDQLERMADERRVIIEDPFRADKYDIGNICNSISGIAYTKSPDNTKLNNTSVQILAGHDPEEEIRLVHARIMDLIRTKNFRYKDIAILASDLEGYRTPTERVLTAHNVPFFIDRTEPVLLNPFIEYIRAFITILSENYAEAAVFRFLKSDLAGFDEEDIYLLENYCLATGIKGSKKWHERFYLHTSTTADDELLKLNEVRERFIAKVDKFIAYLGENRTFNAGSRYTIRQFATALYLLIESDGIEDKLKAASETFKEAGNRKLAAQYGQVYVKAMDILDELCDLIPDEKTDIRGFGALIDAGLDQVKIGILPDGMDYIQVGDLTRSRLDDIKALFIVGANEGYIPKAGASPGILTDREREFLQSNDPELTLAPTSREDMFFQQLYIYMACGKPTDHLFLSYSATNSQGKSLLPAYIVKRALAADLSIRVERYPSIPRYYTDEKEAFDAMTALIYPAITGHISKQMADRLKELLSYFINNEQYRGRLTKILEKEIICSADEMSDSIGGILAHILYGKRITSSITRLETYAKCAYRYFLQYGLKINEREVFSFEAKDIGNIFHDSMKEYSKLMALEGRNWNEISEEDRNLLMDEAVTKVMEQYRREVLSSSARYSHMEERIRSIMKKSAGIISAQLKKGKFAPKYFEVDFDEMDGTSPINIRLDDEDMMRLRGRIDRVDTCETEDGIYVKIIDYKSSQHDIDLAAVYEGRQLQLLVYLNAAMEMERAAATTSGSNKEVQPAAILYYHIDDPFIRTTNALSDEDIHRLIMKAQRLSGLVNKDRDVIELIDEYVATDPTVLPVSIKRNGEVAKSDMAVSAEDLGVLSDYATRCIQKMGNGIISGNIAIPSPDNKTRFTGPDCSFCPYTSVCNGNTTAGIQGEKFGNDDWIALMRGVDVSDGSDT